MGKSSAPPAPTPPSATEIAAANTESARAMMELQRAMQFGDEVMKKGYMREKLGVPQGATPVYSETIVSSSAPKHIYNSARGKNIFEVQSDGTLTLIEKRWPEHKYDRYEGMSWGEFFEKVGSDKQWQGSAESVEVKQPVTSLTGYKNSDGTITDAHQYFKISEDGERETVKREEALQADFTGMGDTDLAKQQWEFEKETSPEKTQFLLDQMKQFGPEFMEQARALVERSDPTGFAARELLGKLAQEYESPDVPDAPVMQEMSEDFDAAEKIGDAPSLGEISDYYEGMIGPQYERAGSLTGFGGQQIAEEQAAAQEELMYGGEQPVGAPPPPDQIYYAGGQDSKATQAVSEGLERLGDVPKYQELNLNRNPELGLAIGMKKLGRMGAAPTLERLEDIPQMEIDPDSLGARRFAEGQYLDRAQAGRTADLMADEARRIARTRAAATGNIFGGGALIEEARAVRQAEDAGQRQGLADLIGFLQSGQTASDYESRLAQQNLANRLMGIQQRTGVEQAEFGMGQQVLAQQNQAALQERADELAALGQRNQAQQQEFENIQASLAQINQARQTQFATDVQATEFNTQQRLRERADELATIAQRNQAQESEYQNLLQALQQQQNVRTAEFGMNQQAIAQRNQAAEADFAKSQSALAQRNQARQQSFANAMQRTATQQQMDQQQMANLQSFSGLAPVSSQFGGLSGAQAQAGANFNPIQYQRTSATDLLQGQQSLQGNIFGTQADIWGQQAQIASQPSGFGSLLGTVGGAWAGTKSGADKIGSSRLNPFNWFGG